MRLRRPPVPALDVREASARVADGTLDLVDVREPAEIAEACVDDARNIPLGDLADVLRQLDRARPVAFLCRSGARSSMAARAAAAAGFDAANVRGGIVAWADAGLPLSRRSKETG